MALVVLAVAVPTRRSAPAAAAAGVSVDSNIAYGVGRERTLDAFVPAGSGLRPAVLFVHGGGWRTGGKAIFDPEAERVAQMGWVGFSINYRLKGFPYETQDVLSAVNWVRRNARRFGVDPSRIGMLGGSAGGNLVGVAATEGNGSLTKGSRVAAVVSWSGPMDLAPMVTDPVPPPPGCVGRTCHQSVDAAKAVAQYIGCLPSVCAGSYRSASPVDMVDHSDAPMFIANSSNEVIPLSQAQDMASRLRVAGVPHTLDVVPGDRHSRQYEDAVWQPSMNFLARWLSATPGSPGPTPSTTASSPEPHRSPLSPGPRPGQSPAPTPHGAVPGPAPSQPSRWPLLLLVGLVVAGLLAVGVFGLPGRRRSGRD